MTFSSFKTRFRSWLIYSVLKNLMGAGWYLYFKTRYIKYWSKLYRKLYEQKFVNIHPLAATSFQDMADFTHDLIWIPDGPKELWDVFKSPEYIQYVGRFGDNKGGDCGAFAIWLVASLNKGMSLGRFQDKLEYYYGGTILSLIWLDKNGKPGAHHCCLITRLSMRDGIRDFAYMDYRMPSEYKKDVDSVLKMIMERYSPNGMLVGWAITDGDSLTPIEVHVS